MKNLLLLAGVLAFSWLNAQEIQKNEWVELQTKFENQQKGNELFLQRRAINKGIAVNQLHPSLKGKIGNFLLYMDVMDADQILATNTDFLYNNTIANVAVMGEGMTIYQWDSGRVENTHQEFQDRVMNLESDDVAIKDHPTAVAGVMAASGVNPQAKGMAPMVNILAYDFNDNYEEMLTESANNMDYMISNHSYGYQAGWRYGDYSDEFGQGWYWFGYPFIDENESVLHGIYSYLDENYDEIAVLAPNHLIVKSAGNDRNLGPDGEIEHAFLNESDDWEVTVGYRPPNCAPTGYDCLPYSGVAKNILLVGSINQISASGRYTGPESVTPSAFSSFGPTDDGRIKPDVVSQGSSIYAPITNNDYYPDFNGTSGSAPSVTGIATLLQQLYYELNTEYLSSAQLKAVILNTTNETGDFPGPDYQYGYGLIDAFQAANAIVDAHSEQALILKDIKGNEEISYRLIATGDGPIKATMVWTDPAKDAESLPFELNNRTPILINDLDMRIIENASLTSYMPWTLDVENPADAAVPGDNVLDNVEQVVIENPTSMQYTITINHKNDLEGGVQPYALVVTGATVDTQGVVNSAENLIEMYPNPTIDRLNVKGLDLSLSHTAKIYSLEGQIIREIKLDEASIDVSDLQKGGYIIVIKNDKSTYADKFIKK